MISCIICSRQPDIPVELKENIASTIGCEYEVIVIDNSKNEYSIFSAYNEGVRRAKGDILCFMHEDILYHTQGWGEIIDEYFSQHSHAGLMGIAGTHILTKIPAGWCDSEVDVGHILQGHYCRGVYEVKDESWAFTSSIPTIVSAIDGMWMCFKREVFNKIKWDTNTFTGFHGYDIDISIQTWFAGYEVHVIWDILVEHKSLGMFNDSFYETYDKLWLKWSGIFPFIKGVELTINEQQYITKIVELKKQHRANIRKYYSSYAYRLGMLLLSPFYFVKRLIVNVKKNYRL